MVATVVVTVAGLEVALADVRVRQLLPPRLVYYHSAVSLREDALLATHREHGRIDVLFIGSSIVRTDIQPLLFDHLIHAQCGESVVSFNVGMLGLWPAGVQKYLDRVWLPAARPRIVVQGIRYPELTATTFAHDEDQFFSGIVERGWRGDSLAARITSAATARLRLLQYRGTLPVQLQRWLGGRPGAVDDDQHLLAGDGRGFTPRLPILPEALAADLVTDTDPHSGTCANDGCQFGLAALRAAQEVAARAGAVYVLVNVPEFAARWPGVQGRRSYAEYLSTLRTLAAERKLAFIDVTNGDPERYNDPEEFSDYFHMSPQGAARFTRELATALSLTIDDGKVDESAAATEGEAYCGDPHTTASRPALTR